MARDEVRIDITADDKASDDLRDVQDLADRLEQETIEVAIDTNAEAAAREIKRVREAADDSADGVNRLGSESDQTRSVMANLVGNSTQDLGELGGIAGTAGVAIGQLGEYATDGNIALGNLAKMAGPMLALAVATKLVTDRMQKAAEVREFHAGQVETFTESLWEGVDAQEAFADAMRDTGRVEVEIQGDIKNLTGVLARAGLTVEDFARLTRMSDDELEAWGAAQRRAGADAEATTLIMLGAAGAHDDLGTAAEEAGARTDVFGQKTDEAGRAAHDAATDVDFLGERYDRLLGKLSAESAYLSAAQGFDDVEAAAFEAYTTAATGSADAEQAARDHQQSVIDLRSSVADYLTQVDDIPASVLTQIDALIQEGNYAEAQRRLDALEQERTAPVNVHLQGDWGEWVRFQNSGGGVPFAAGPRSAAPMTVTINAPRGTRPAELVGAIDNWARRNGRLRR